MYNVTIVDESGKLAQNIKNMKLWQQRDDFILTPPIFSEKTCMQEIDSLRTDIIFLPAHGRSVENIPLLNSIRSSRRAIHFILVGEQCDYEYVRQVFWSGALDYLISPLEEIKVVQSISRIYSSMMSREHMYKIIPKVSVLIDNLFAEDGADVPQICRHIVTLIYEEFKDNKLNAQMMLNKLKDYIYNELIFRKPWLKNFLHAEKYIYKIGFKKREQEDIIWEWIKDFNCVGSIIKKYHMIDHKLSYPIGKYIVVHVDEKLTLDKLSKAVYLNKNYISNVFKKHVGMSVVNFVNEVKVDRAKILLMDKNRKIQDIAELLNYSDAEYFTQVFKQKTGITPTQYRGEY